ncbi:hypothetical protein ABFS82_04G118300 [Erythranthe guttata]|uniref:uncharacterized protein LOC105972284 n=1 Tax=Erythranthe guttata TaxID=4155 RepID=UPI00064D8B8A|nr:PREDICTED: uncharacterized protein LOC105972284 [Erythranthe guttata]|eukprot:XP_012852674.1 PREDICTED: uncharacterized protein LOC105972284 [Erythranthe guttata]
MEAEFRKLKSAPSFKRRFDPAATSSLLGGGGELDEELPRYTSLKDIISSFNSSSPKHADQNDPNSISIRNELVKHAASAYVLSATVINPPSRDDYYQDWIIPGIWDGLMTSCAGFCSCLQFHVGNPLHDLCRPLFGIIYRVFCRIRNGI